MVVGQLAGVVHDDLLALHRALVLDGGRGDDEVQVVLALQALLHDLHVQQPQEAAAEAEAHGRRHLQAHSHASTFMLPEALGPPETCTAAPGKPKPMADDTCRRRRMHGRACRLHETRGLQGLAQQESKSPTITLRSRSRLKLLSPRAALHGGLLSTAAASSACIFSSAMSWPPYS